jgi:hypothetical protein
MASTNEIDFDFNNMYKNCGQAKIFDFIDIYNNYRQAHRSWLTVLKGSLQLASE